MGEQRWALKWLSFSNRKMKGYHMGCCLPGSGAVTHVHSALAFSLLPAGGRWQWPDSHTLISRAGATDGAIATGMSVKDHPPPPPRHAFPIPFWQTGSSGSFLFRFWGHQCPTPRQMCQRPHAVFSKFFIQRQTVFLAHPCISHSSHFTTGKSLFKKPSIRLD